MKQEWQTKLKFSISAVNSNLISCSQSNIQLSQTLKEYKDIVSSAYYFACWGLQFRNHHQLFGVSLICLTSIFLHRPPRAVVSILQCPVSRSWPHLLNEDFNYLTESRWTQEYSNCEWYSIHEKGYCQKDKMRSISLTICNTWSATQTVFADRIEPTG